MASVIQKNDFIELDFSGKSNGKVFDTTKKEEAKDLELKESEVKPIIISAGNEMVLKSFDSEIIGKEIGKKYVVHLTPDKAFGKRDPTLIKTIPIRIFHEKNIAPVPGMAFQMDNYLVRILSVSGGRVTSDFNNPLAGKEVDYEFTIKRKVDDDKEKVNALQDYFFRKRFEFEIKDKKVIFHDKKIKPLVELMSPKFREISGLDFVAQEVISMEDASKKQLGVLDKDEKTSVNVNQENTSESKSKKNVKDKKS
jgi:FKBP-type peptidyl-prolyl cis-trans isomerase 2